MPLYHVDPRKAHGRWYAAVERFARSRPGQLYARHVAPCVDAWLYRKTRGRYPFILGGPATAPLMTTGAKSGQPREHQVSYFHDEQNVIVIASNYGGPKHPHWYYNLKAHHQCELGGEKFVASEVTDPVDHAYLYGLAERVYAGWRDYRLKTEPIGRRIPVFRLRPG